ncbi:class F sortase [Streptomyces sp. CS147]|uniref:class F sortase n=1 Tax=Streptomyces sp. CS147 TaxID=2162715 RepID=UPI000D50FF83|nr:class F sortase [Streptomyces sp. CS147]PVC94566.1 class F sortase [Streptomyces sp. CS147]
MPSPRTPQRFRRTAALLTAVAVCVALTGCSSTEPSAATATAPSASARDETGSGPTARSRADATERSAPTEVTIPSLGVRSTLMELGLNADGTVEVPPAEKGMTAGWYRGGSVPGAPGPAVLIGHNDTRFGRAVFHDLKDIREGAEVLVRDGAGKTLRFTVTGKEAVSKKAFPTEKVYGPTKGSTLRLITCDGEFDAEGHPVDNLIVYGAVA